MLTRQRLKQQGITYTSQLLEAAGTQTGRTRLANEGRIDMAVLWRLVRRADLARINGIGAIFADMLEMVGVDRVASLATEDPEQLHRKLVALNSEERLARRSPTPEEVADWVDQARGVPTKVEDAAG